MISFPSNYYTTKGRNMSKSLSVKVSTAKLIKALEAALTKREKEANDYKKARADYEKEHKEFVKNLTSLIGTNKVTLKDTSFREKGWKTDLPEVEFTFTINGSVKVPKEPERNASHYANERECDEIRNAISLLKMTDDEYVGTSTYKGVAQYL